MIPALKCRSARLPYSVLVQDLANHRICDIAKLKDVARMSHRLAIEDMLVLQLIGRLLREIPYMFIETKSTPGCTYLLERQERNRLIISVLRVLARIHTPFDESFAPRTAGKEVTAVGRCFTNSVTLVPTQAIVKNLPCDDRTLVEFSTNACNDFLQIGRTCSFWRQFRSRFRGYRYCIHLDEVVALHCVSFLDVDSLPLVARVLDEGVLLEPAVGEYVWTANGTPYSLVIILDRHLKEFRG